MSIGPVVDASPAITSHHDNDREIAFLFIAKLINGSKVEGEWILCANLTCKMKAQDFTPGFTNKGHSGGQIYYV